MRKLAILLLLFAVPALACTDFQVKARDGSVLISRSMEFALPLKSALVTIPRGQTIVSRTLDGKKGIEWTSKYGFLGINAFGMQQAVLDGMNEAGLSVEFLWFIGSKYQEPVPGKFLAITDLALWMLGNFKTVDEVEKEIRKIKIVGVYVPQLKQVPGFHAAVHDASGKNLVIEFIDGKTMIYDNPLGVMTNRPTFDWHLTNLRNYLTLKPNDSQSIKLDGVKIDSTGAGNGWFGLPGDWTPPTRFVRAALFVNNAPKPKNAREALVLSEHILDTVDIPYGLINTGMNMFELTQWSIIKDLKNKVLYFRSYENHQLKKVDLKKLDLAPGAKIKSYPLETVGVPEDVTGQLK